MPNRRKFIFSIPYSLIPIIVTAAALRFWGISWGLPNSLHSYSYHPDEFLTIGAAASIIASFFPRFYNYPSLYLYLAALAFAVASAYGHVSNLTDAYMCMRIITALMGVAAVAAAYWAGKSIWGRAEGYVAAVVLCVAPLHVQHSHFATVDVPSTLFVAACLGFAGLVLKRGSWRDYIMCGLMAGLAAGTKYNAGLVVLSLIAAHFLGRNAGLRRLLAALGCTIGAFFLTTPGAIVQWSNFTYGLTYELHHSAAGHGLVFAGTGNGFIYTFQSSLWYGLGPGLAILFAIAAIYGLCRRDKNAVMILAFALPYYVLISLSQVRFARYALPLFPAAALLIGWMVRNLWTRLPKSIKWIWAGVCVVILTGTLLYSIALDRLFVLPDPRDSAAKWIFTNISKGSRIGMVDVPWFYSPPYTKNIGLGTLLQRENAAYEMPYKWTLLVDGAHPMPLSSPRWAVISDFEIVDAERLHSDRSLPLRDRERVSGINKSMDTIKRDYLVRRMFSNSLGIFGSTQSLPHDMRYIAPTIWIYELKK